jgi:hypothetical protein
MVALFSLLDALVGFLLDFLGLKTFFCGFFSGATKNFLSICKQIFA